MTAPQPSSPSRGPSDQRNGPQQKLRGTTRGYTLVLTNVGKVIGMATFVNEAWIRDQQRYGILLMCGLLVLGAQVAENIVLRMIDRFFGDSPS